MGYGFEEYQKIVIAKLKDYLPQSYRGMNVQVENRLGTGNHFVLNLPDMELEFPRTDYQLYSTLGAFEDDMGKLLQYMAREIYKMGLNVSTTGRSLPKWNDMKEHLQAGLWNEPNHRLRFRQVVHMPVQETDCAVVYRLTLWEDLPACYIDQKALNHLGITPEELHRTAMEITQRNCPIYIGSMPRYGFLRPIEITDQLKEPPDHDGIYDVSNRQHLWGAVSMLYPGVLDRLAESLHGNLVIYPSSIHKVRVVRDDLRLSAKKLDQDVAHENECFVRLSDRLSEQAYYYDCVKRCLSLVSNAEQRPEVKIKPVYETRPDIQDEMER